jgi:hypothetical protein
MTVTAGTMFRKAGSHVVSEMIDEEVICLDLATGTYYSMRGTAAAIWSLASAGGRGEAIAAAVSNHFDDPPGDAAALVIAFLEELVRAGLLETVSVPPTSLGTGPATSLGTGSSVRSHFHPPALESYTDMQQFLLVDPIHEVDVTRWPTPEKK